MRLRLVHPGCGNGMPTRENLHAFMRAVHTAVVDHADSWPFVEPVEAVQACMPACCMLSCAVRPLHCERAQTMLTRLGADRCPTITKSSPSR